MSSSANAARATAGLRSPAESKVAQYDKWVKTTMVALDVTERLIWLIFCRNEGQ